MSFAQQVSSTLLSVTLLVALLVPLIVSLLVSLEVLLSLLPPAASVGKLNMYSPASDEQHMAAVSQWNLSAVEATDDEDEDEDAALLLR